MKIHWKCFGLVLGCIALLFASQASAAQAPIAATREGRASIDLSGNWEFKLDPSDVGRAEKWFDGTVSFDRTIQVPGCWNAQGVGYTSEEQLRKYEDQRLLEQKALNGLGILNEARESTRLFHVYPGPGWYRKQVTIPKNWSGKVPWLIFNGVHREAELWVNGQSAGGHISYLTPFRVDLSQYAKAGETISIVMRVDARRRKEVDPFIGCLDTLDFLYVSWGGIYRPVTLEAVDSTQMENVFILPQVATETVEIRVAIQGNRNRQLTLVADILDSHGAPVSSVRESVADDTAEGVLNTKIKNAKLWSPKTPNLYTARIKLFAGETVIDSRSVRFGMREFKVDGAKFLLNGKPIFLRGYGDDCIFPNTISPPTNKREYQRRLSIAREYGFNYVRHHSWIPPEEYFEAADELGMMVQPEFPFSSRWDMPSTPEAKRNALEQWGTIIRLYRNHPSLVTWCMGNELYDSFEQAPEMYRVAKRLDPSRPVIESDGCNFGSKDRKTLDFLVVPFGEETSIGYQDGKYNFAADIGKPVVAHEMGYFVTLPDLQQLDLFKTGMRPYWLLQARDLARRNHLLDVYPKWLKASYRLQAVSLKSNMEAARRSRLNGTSVWLLQDYPNCAEGVTDMFLRPKAFRPEEFRKFNAPTVLLLDAPRRTFWNGETADIKFIVSRFEDDPSDSATLRWALTSGSRTITNGFQGRLKVRSDGVQELAQIKLKMPFRKSAEKLRLTAEIADANGKIKNEWDLWTFPQDTLTMTSRNVRGLGLGALGALRPSIREHSEGAIPPGTDLLVTTRMDQYVRDYLESGGSVFLLDPASAFAVERTNFRLSSWDGGGPSGTIFDGNHAALRAMPSDGWCDLQFYSLLQGSKTILLDSLPERIEPLVRCVDRPTRLANRAYLFEASIGKGKLLVSGFNFAQAISTKDPAGIFLFDQLLHYATGNDFAPSVAIAASALKTAKAK